EIRRERVRARVRDAMPLEKLLHLAILAVLAMEPDDNGVELRQDPSGRYRPAAFMPLPLLVYVQVTKRVPLLGQVRENGMPGLEGHLVLLRRTAPQDPHHRAAHMG